MRVVAFVGSPRKGGNTDVLVQELLKGAADSGADTKIYYLNEMSIKGCQACYYCKQHDGCRLKDDMTPLYDEIKNADAIVLGTPVYFAQMTGQMKIFIDRWFALLGPNYAKRYSPDKKTVIIAPQGNADENTFKPYLELVANNMTFMFDYKAMVLNAPGTREIGAAAENDKLMTTARQMGKEL